MLGYPLGYKTACWLIARVATILYSSAVGPLLFRCRRSAIIPCIVANSLLWTLSWEHISSPRSHELSLPMLCCLLLYTKVEAFFGGTDVPIEVAIGVCLATVLTFGSAQRKVSKLLRGNEDAKER